LLRHGAVLILFIASTMGVNATGSIWSHA